MKEQAFPPFLKQKNLQIDRKKKKETERKKRTEIRPFVLTRNKLPRFKVDDNDLLLYWLT